MSTISSAWLQIGEYKLLGRRKRNRYKFTEKKQSKRGIAALVVAILIEIVYIVFLNAAFRGDGTLSMYYGSAGITHAWHISGRFRVCHQKPL